jgi:hypothetical protein
MNYYQTFMMFRRHFSTVQIIYTHFNKPCIENIVLNHFKHFVVSKESNDILKQNKLHLDFQNNLSEQHFVQHLLANSGFQHLWIENDEAKK